MKTNSEQRGRDWGEAKFPPSAPARSVCFSSDHGPWSRQAAAVLLEVVLALVLFAAAATVIGGAIHSAVEAVQRQKLQVHASNLAATVLTELQLGLRSVATPGPEPFAEPFTDWTWQLALSPREEPLAESSPLTIVEVIVRHEDPPMVYRLAQGLTLPKHAAGAANDSWRTPP